MKEISKLVHPKNEEEFQGEALKILDEIGNIDPKTIKCFAGVVVYEKAGQMIADHFLLGDKMQIARLLASTISAVGETFRDEEVSREMPKESKQ